MRNTTAAMPLTIMERTARSPLVWAMESGRAKPRMARNITPMAAPK